jgi:hypothetical protein
MEKAETVVVDETAPGPPKAATSLPVPGSTFPVTAAVLEPVLAPVPDVVSLLLPLHAARESAKSEVKTIVFNWTVPFEVAASGEQRACRQRPRSIPSADAALAAQPAARA